VSQVRTLTPNVTVVALKIWLTAPKMVKNGNVWYKFSPKENFWWSTEKVIGAQLQIFLYEMTP